MITLIGLAKLSNGQIIARAAIPFALLMMVMVMRDQRRAKDKSRNGAARTPASKGAAE